MLLHHSCTSYGSIKVGAGGGEGRGEGRGARGEGGARGGGRGEASPKGAMWPLVSVSGTSGPSLFCLWLN
jgi:hypothetical protein